MDRPYKGQWKAKCPQPNCSGSVYKRGNGTTWTFFQCNHCGEVWEASEKVIRLVAKHTHEHIQLVEGGS